MIWRDHLVCRSIEINSGLSVREKSIGANGRFGADINADTVRRTDEKTGLNAWFSGIIGIPPSASGLRPRPDCNHLPSTPPNKALSLFRVGKPAPSAANF
jgi:hypothetical protein